MIAPQENTAQGSAERVAVCVCTYRRPQQLARLLKEFAAMARPPSTLFVIVDNDGTDARTEKIARDFQENCGVPVIYALEPEPGLSAARNAALRSARNADAALVAFVDDDEWPSPDWLLKLMKARSETGAAVVGGPVHPVFETEMAPRARYRHLWSVQKGRLRGIVHVYCTCNCLIDLSAVAFLGDAPFPHDFRFTGGEDVVFFRRLHAGGIKMAWCDDAVVFEEISGERATLGWLRRRWYRLGNIGVRCERAAPLKGTPPALFKTVALGLRLMIYPLLDRRVFAMPMLWLLEAERIRGRLASHAGSVVMQYGRQSVQP